MHNRLLDYDNGAPDMLPVYEAGFRDGYGRAVWEEGPKREEIHRAAVIWTTAMCALVSLAVGLVRVWWGK